MPFLRDFTELNIMLLWRTTSKVGHRGSFHIKQSKNTYN